jgi:hypothetical protein
MAWWSFQLPPGLVIWSFFFLNGFSKIQAVWHCHWNCALHILFLVSQVPTRDAAGVHRACEAPAWPANVLWMAIDSIDSIEIHDESFTCANWILRSSWEFLQSLILRASESQQPFFSNGWGVGPVGLYISCGAHEDGICAEGWEEPGPGYAFAAEFVVNQKLFRCWLKGISCVMSTVGNRQTPHLSDSFRKNPGVLSAQL